MFNLKKEQFSKLDLKQDLQKNDFKIVCLEYKVSKDGKQCVLFLGGSKGSLLVMDLVRSKVLKVYKNVHDQTEINNICCYKEIDHKYKLITTDQFGTVKKV